MKRVLLLIVYIGMSVLVGCHGVTQPSDSQATSSADHSSSNNSKSQPTESLANCQVSSMAFQADIAGVVDWINALPKPLSLPCFLASLPRPIFYNATISHVSAQQSIGRENPRFFFLQGLLAMSFVPQEKLSKAIVDGELAEVWDVDDTQLLELSYRVVPDMNTGRNQDPQSIKAEIHFPVYENLSQDVPYRTILATPTSQNSLCASCHAGETIIDHINGIPIIRSRMVRNRFDSEVPEQELLTQYSTCDSEADENAWYRCRMYDAIFGQGPLNWLSFSRDIPDFF